MTNNCATHLFFLLETCFQLAFYVLEHSPHLKSTRMFDDILLTIKKSLFVSENLKEIFAALL